MDVKTGASVPGRTLISPTWRYEAGSAQPTLDALIGLAKVLHVRLDDLVFGDERGPGEDLALSSRRSASSRNMRSRPCASCWRG